MDNTKKKELKKYSLLLEELSWVLSPNNISDLKKLSNLLRHPEELVLSPKRIETTCQKRLVGVLPSLLQDLDLFPKNEDLAEFSKSILSIEISRYHKKSRYEIIGSIVCEVANSPQSAQKDVVDAITELEHNDNLKMSIKNSKKTSMSFSWNDAIRLIR